MIIFVSNSLPHIKEELIKRGYNIIDNNENIYYDAVICELKNGDLINYNIQRSVKNDGTLIIDSGGKTVDEIEYILSNRQLKY